MSRFSKIILRLYALFFIAVVGLLIFVLPYLSALLANTLYFAGAFLILLIPILAFITSLRLLITHNGFAAEFNSVDKTLILLPIISIGLFALFILGINLTT